MMLDFAAIHLHAQLAEAAYISDEVQAAKAFQVLGYKVIGSYENDDHQAYALINPDCAGLTLAISGTRASELKLADVLDDAMIEQTDIGSGARVMFGTYKGLSDLYTWAKNRALETIHALGTVLKWTVCGHSLGGERAQLAGLFIPDAQLSAIYAYEAPKCGNDALWTMLVRSVVKMTAVCNGHDLWFGWPWISDWKHPPIQHIHLTDGGWKFVGPVSFPPFVSADDHDISMVVKLLGDIAEKSQ